MLTNKQKIEIKQILEESKKYFENLKELSDELERKVSNLSIKQLYEKVKL